MQKHEDRISELSVQKLIFSEFENIKTLISEQRLDEAKNTISELHIADLADLIDSVSSEYAITIFSLIENDFDPELLELLSSRSNIIAVEYYGVPKISKFVSTMNSSDAIAFMDEVGDEIKDEILELLPEENRLYILEGYNYSEHSAGRVMSKKYLVFYEHWSVGQSIDSIRATQGSDEEFHAVVVVNAKTKPVGTISLSKLLQENRTMKLSQVINQDLRVADTSTSLTDLVYIFKHYALSIVPVVNKSGKLVGTISIDNIVFIMDEQAEDAILHFGGVNEIDIYDSFLSAAKQRFPWLFLNLGAACITSFVINHFTPIISKFVALAPLMQVVASMGGNATTQTMTITIIAITNKDISKIHIMKLIAKEYLTCGLNGIVLGLLGSILVIGLFQDYNLAKVFFISIVAIFMLGGIFGSAIPIALDKLKFDPAPSSGVIVAAIIDSFGFLIFLGLASLIMQS